jgi:hypothetical protein
MLSMFLFKINFTSRVYENLAFLVITFISILFFFEIKPYFLWGNGVSFFRAVTLMFICVSIIFLLKYKQISRKSLLMLSLYLFVMVVMGFYSDGIYIGSVFAIFVISTILLLDDNVKYKAYATIVNVFVILTFPGIVVFIFLLIGFEFKYELISPLNTLKGELYRNYFFLVVPDSDVQLSPFGVVFRYSGVFDEPGVIGTFCGIFLSTRYVYDNLARRCYFILIGMCSMSLTFFILFVIIILMQNPKKNIVMSFLCLIIFLSMSSWLKQISVIDRFVFSRIELLLNFDSSINNREVSGFNYKFNELFETSDFILGKGGGAASSEFAGGFSYKYFIYDHGILAFLAINIFFLFMIYSSNINLKDKLIFSMVLFLSLLQRPYYDSISIVIIILGATAIPFIPDESYFSE